MGKIKFHWNKDTTILIAQKQWGKTTTIKELTQGIPKEDIIVLDSNYEYKNFPNRWKPKNKNSVELDNFIRYCRQFKDKLLIIEDIDLYFESTKPSQDFKNFLTDASHQDLGLIATIKKPLGIPRLLMTEGIHYFIGKFDLQNERKYLEDFVNTKDVIENLQRHEFLYRNKDTNEEFIWRTKS